MIVIGTVILIIPILIRVKSGNFGHQVNSDIPLQTVEIQMGRLPMISTVCLVYLLFYSNN